MTKHISCKKSHNRFQLVLTKINITDHTGKTLKQGKTLKRNNLHQFYINFVYNMKQQKAIEKKSRGKNL